jgi:hypothetical protein
MGLTKKYVQSRAREQAVYPWNVELQGETQQISAECGYQPTCSRAGLC